MQYISIMGIVDLMNQYRKDILRLYVIWVKCIYHYNPLNWRPETFLKVDRGAIWPTTAQVFMAWILTMLAATPAILLMAEILHQLIGRLSHDLQGFTSQVVSRISSINSICSVRITTSRPRLHFFFVIATWGLEILHQLLRQCVCFVTVFFFSLYTHLEPNMELENDGFI